LIQVVDGVLAYGFEKIVIVNDGSAEENLKYFPDTEKYPQCTILTHEVNKGKGAALKTAFKYILDNYKDCAGVVTVDGDNQHKAADIFACAEAMCNSKGTLILGVRDFSLPHVPPRSRAGNRLTSFVFRTGCGLKISDTQTGLRAIPAEYLPIFLKTKGERFEYETNMLLEMKTYNIPFSEVKIETVYIEENKTSHFNPLRDSFRIYKLIFKFMLSSASATLLDLGLFFVLSLLFNKLGFGDSIFIPTAIARLISSFYNYMMNKNVVFKSNQNAKVTVVKYYILAAFIMLLSAGGVKLLSVILYQTRPIIRTIIKAVIDSILALLSFYIQREWVFSNKGDNKK